MYGAAHAMPAAGAGPAYFGGMTSAPYAAPHHHPVGAAEQQPEPHQHQHQQQQQGQLFAPEGAYQPAQYAPGPGAGAGIATAGAGPAVAGTYSFPPAARIGFSPGQPQAGAAAGPSSAPPHHEYYASGGAHAAPNADASAAVAAAASYAAHYRNASAPGMIQHNGPLDPHATAPLIPGMPHQQFGGAGSGVVDNSNSSPSAASFSSAARRQSTSVTSIGAARSRRSSHSDADDGGPMTGKLLPPGSRDGRFETASNASTAGSGPAAKRLKGASRAVRSVKAERDSSDDSAAAGRRASQVAASGEEDEKAPTGSVTMFQCTGFPGCSMVFTRSEHLARHVRKHTGERPFRCHCLKAFSRLDNLRQHAQTVHADTPERNEEMMQELAALHASLAKSAAQKQVVHQQVLGKANPNDVPINANSRKSKTSRPASARAAKRGSVVMGMPSSLPPHLMQAHFGGPMAGKVIPRSNSMSEASIMSHAAPFMGNPAIGAAQRGGLHGSFDPLVHRHSIANHHIPPMRGLDVTAAAAAVAGQAADPNAIYPAAAPYAADGHYDLQQGAGPAGPIYFGYDGTNALQAGIPPQVGAAPGPGYAAPYAAQASGFVAQPSYDVYGNPIPVAAPPAGGPVADVYDLYSGGQQQRANSYHATTAWNGGENSWRRESDATSAGSAYGPGYGQGYGAGVPPASAGDRFAGNGGGVQGSTASYAVQPNYSMGGPNLHHQQPLGAGPGASSTPFSPFNTRPNSSHGAGMRPSSVHGMHAAPGSPTERPTLPPLSSLSRPGTAISPTGPPAGAARTSFGHPPSSSGGDHARRLSSRGGSRSDPFELGASSLVHFGGKVGVDPPRLPSRSGLSSVPGILSETRSRRNSMSDHQFGSQHLNGHGQDNASPFHFQPPPPPSLKRGSAEAHEGHDSDRAGGEGRRLRGHSGGSDGHAAGEGGEEDDAYHSPRPQSRRVSIAELCGD